PEEGDGRDEIIARAIGRAGAMGAGPFISAHIGLANWPDTRHAVPIGGTGFGSHETCRATKEAMEKDAMFMRNRAAALAAAGLI
ncbi:hypothetical protein HWN78_27260, partial [Escherichia coli]|uniref:hypothetical protein n=1 Tax=Escherichia coli TaxID=562 RepID=UPI00159BB6A5